jgi:hypothetical protein
MKEKILEILNNNPFVDRTDDDNAAEEITSMVFEFVEYAKDNTDTVFNPMYGQYFWSDKLQEFTTEELFNYWLTNIYKK